MSMDVIGVEPRSSIGECFRRSVWSWHPLAKYCQQLPAAKFCNLWHTNDGDGLCDSDASALAKQLRHAIANGNAGEYIAKRRRMLNDLPDENCDVCGGTGKRKKPPEIGPGDLECNGCNGKGTVRPFECTYRLDISDLNDFAAFLEDCGGFKIF